MPTILELLDMQLLQREVRKRHRPTTTAAPAETISSHLHPIPLTETSTTCTSTTPHSEPITVSVWRTVFKQADIRSQLATHLGARNDSDAVVPSWVERFVAALPQCTASAVTTELRRLGIAVTTESHDDRSQNGVKVGQRVRCMTFSRFWPSFETFIRDQREAESQARLRALKENDPEAYLAHLTTTKVTSLLRIMETTHRFMSSIGAQLERQQSEQADGGTAASILSSLDHRDGKRRTAAESEEFVRFKEYVASTKDEYKLVHRTATFVETQPAGLDATLLPHQLDGLRFLASLHANRINGILADEMGVGKTIQTISFLLHLKERRAAAHALRDATASSVASPSARSGPHLILAPLSIVREWKEAASMFVSRSMRVMELQEAVDAGCDLHSCDLVLLAIHRVRLVSHMLSRVSWEYVVVDEAHKAVSNLTTVTAQSICAIPYRHRLVLTGTPLNSDLRELWSLLHFINPHIFTESQSFDEVFRRPFQDAALVQSGGACKAAASAMQLTEEEQALLVMRMHQVLRPFMLRRTKKDIDSKLRIQFYEVRCPLTAVQSELLCRLRQQKELPAFVEKRCTSRSCLTIESSAQAICNHAFMIPFFSQVLHHRRPSITVDTTTHPQEDAGDAVSSCEGDELENVEDKEAAVRRARSAFDQPLALGCSGKFLVLDLILRRAHAAGVKVVIFTHWLDCMDLIEELFHWRGWSANEQYVVLNGTSSAEERKACVERFRTSQECFFFLVSMKAGGCGLNLQVAHLILMLDRDYTGSNEDQAIARVFRIGQQHLVKAVYFSTDDASEQRIADIAERKNKPRYAIIEGGSYRTEVVSEEERKTALLNATASINAEVIDARRLTELPPDVFDVPLLIPTPAVESTSADCTTQRRVTEALKTEPCAASIRCADAFQEPDDVPPILRAALAESCRPQESADDLGRGKRERNAFSMDDLPPDDFWSKWADEGLDDDEIKEKWIAARERQRLIESRCTVTFSSLRTTDRRRDVQIDLSIVDVMRRVPRLADGGH